MTNRDEELLDAIMVEPDEKELCQLVFAFLLEGDDGRLAEAIRMGSKPAAGAEGVGG